MTTARNLLRRAAIQALRDAAAADAPGEYLSLARRALGWSQTDLAARFDGIQQDAISEWETGRREPSDKSRTQLALLADALEGEL